MRSPSGMSCNIPCASVLWRNKDRHCSCTCTSTCKMCLSILKICQILWLYNLLSCNTVTSVCCICIRCKLVLVSTVADTFCVFFLGHSRPRESLESCKTLVSHCYTVMVIQITESDNVLKLTVLKFCSKPWWSNSGK